MPLHLVSGGSATAARGSVPLCAGRLTVLRLIRLAHRQGFGGAVNADTVGRTRPPITEPAGDRPKIFFSDSRASLKGVPVHVQGTGQRFSGVGQKVDRAVVHRDRS